MERTAQTMEKDKDTPPDSDTQRLIQEPQVHQIELEIRNENLQQARVEAGLAKYVDLYDYAPVAYFTFDRDSTILQVNLTGASLLGVERQWLVKQHFDSFIAEESRPAFNAFLERAFASQDKQIYEISLLRGGQPLYVRIEAVAAEPEHVCHAVLIDITEDKQMQDLVQLRMHLKEYASAHMLEELLRETLDKVGSLVNSPIGFYHFISTDEKFIILQTWSTRTLNEFCTMKGRGLHYPIEKGGVWVDCVRRHKPVIHNDYASLPHKKGMPEGHAKVIRELVVPIMRDGKIVAILGVGNKPTDYTKKDVEIVSFMADVAWSVAESKRAEEELKRLQEEQEIILDSVPALIFYKDKENNFIRVNKVFAKAMGMSKEQMEGKSVSDFYSEEQAKAFWRDDKEVLASGKPKIGIIEPMDAGKGRLWVQTDKLPYKDAQGNIIGIIGFAIDITERKQTEEALQRAHNELEQKVRERTTDLTSTVKSLRNEIEQRLKVEEDLRSANEQLETQSNRLRILAGELTMAEQRERKRIAGILHDDLQQQLALAKLQVSCLEQTDKNSFFTATKNIENLLADTINISRSLTADLSPPILHETGLKGGLEWLVKRKANKYGLKIHLSAGENIPELEEDLKIMLLGSTRELVFNAIKHAKVDSLSIDLKIVDGRYLQITVSDSGLGFDPLKIKTAGEIGAGYGLFSIRERLVLFRGKLKMDSALGRGSRFIITVPITPEEPEPQQTSVEEDNSAGTEIPADGQKSGKQIRVLVVDDHAMMREGLIGMLKLEPDIEVAGEAQNGYEAIEKACALMPDVILMDISMPVLNGISATRAIHEKFPVIRVIGVSMYEEEERLEAMRDAGAVNYLTKSGPRADLIAAIRNCMK